MSMQGLVDAGAARAPIDWETLTREYSYMNFPAIEILEWLLPQVEGTQRVVFLDDTEGKAVKTLSALPEFRRIRLAGLWLSGNGNRIGGEGAAVFRSMEEIVSARPDCLVPIFRRLHDAPLDLKGLAQSTGARVLPSVLFENPFARSMTIRYSGSEGPGMDSPDVPPQARQSFKRHLQRYYLASQLSRGRRAVDCAAGCGYGTHILARTAREVVGIDMNPDLLRYARKYNGGPAIRYLCGDLVQVSDGLRAEFLASVETFEHVPDGSLPEFIRSMSRILVPGGILFCTTPKAPVTLHRPPNRQHVAEYSTEEFVDRLSAAFDVQKILFQTHDGRFLESLPEGYPLPDSTNLAHVVQIAIATALTA